MPQLDRFRHNMLLVCVCLAPRACLVPAFLLLSRVTCACELQGSGAAAVKKKRPLGGLSARLGGKVGDVANELNPVSGHLQGAG